MAFSEVMKEGIKSVYSSDMETQKDYMDFICKRVRGMSSSDIVFRASGVFVPNNEYLQKFYPVEIINPDYGVYDSNGNCLWQGFIIFPIKNVVGDIVGLAGFSPQRYVEAHENQDWSINYYTYSTKKVFEKGKYLYCLDGVYRSALKDGYVLLVDGLFDCLSLTSEGYNAVALLGSSPTEEIIAQLRFINKVIIISDNDDAGIRLEHALQKKLKNVIFLHQGKTKDVDELLKTEEKEIFKKTLNTAIKETLLLNKSAIF